jgi:hypothetical protein
VGIGIIIVQGGNVEKLGYTQKGWRNIKNIYLLSRKLFQPLYIIVQIT